MKHLGLKGLVSFIFVLFFVCAGLFATTITLDEFDVSSYDEIRNTYYTRSVNVFYDEETGLVGFSYYRDNRNTVKYTYYFTNQSEIDSIVAKLENVVKIINGELTISQVVSNLGTDGFNTGAYEFNSRVDIDRDELIEVGSVGSVYRTSTSIKLSFSIMSGWRILVIGGDSISFFPGGRKVVMETLGLNADCVKRLIKSLKKENLDEATTKRPRPNFDYANYY